MKRCLALVWIVCCMAGCALGEQRAWTDAEWQAIVEALASDEAEPVEESRRTPFRSAWLPEAERGYANILLLSTDSPEIERNFGRTDAILVCRVNLYNGGTRLLSLPEDALISLPEAPEPIALRYVNCFGGAGLTARCVNDALGLWVNRFCAVNIDSFIGIVDGLGGVTMDLTEGEAQSLGLEKGKNQLNGEQALRYVKLRRPGDGSGRVRALLEAVLRQTAEGDSLSRALRLADLLLPAVDTNLTTDDLMDLVFALFGQEKAPSFSALGLRAEEGWMNQCAEYLYGEE